MPGVGGIGGEARRMSRGLKDEEEGREGILEGQHSQGRGLGVWMCWGVRC